MKRQIKHKYMTCLWVRLIVGLICLAALHALNIYAQEPGGGPGEGLENNLYDARLILAAKEEIGLSKEQEEKIENLMLQNGAEAIRQGAEIKILELRFTSFLKSQAGKIDRKEVETYIREISRKKVEMTVRHMNYLLDVRQTLTVSQIQKLKEYKKKHPMPMPIILTAEFPMNAPFSVLFNPFGGLTNYEN